MKRRRKCAIASATTAWLASSMPASPMPRQPRSSPTCAIGAGIGGRFYTNFGPIRVDVATPLNRRKGEGRFNIYVSIGQAF
jgi:outer membrane protein assembly factor BamA